MVYATSEEISKWNSGAFGKTNLIQLLYLLPNGIPFIFGWHGLYHLPLLTFSVSLWIVTIFGPVGPEIILVSFIPLLSWASSFSHSTRSSGFFLWVKHHVRHYRSRNGWAWGPTVMRFTVWWGTITHLYPTWHTVVVLDYLSLCTGKKTQKLSCGYSH